MPKLFRMPKHVEGNEPQENCNFQNSCLDDEGALVKKEVFKNDRHPKKKPSLTSSHIEILGQTTQDSSG